jgi:hypothetical protein
MKLTKQKFLPNEQHICGDYYTYCSDLYEPEYLQMYQWRANINGLQGSNKKELSNPLTVLIMSATTANAGTFDPTVAPTSTLSPMESNTLTKQSPCPRFLATTWTTNNSYTFLTNVSHVMAPANTVTNNNAGKKCIKGKGVYGELVEPPTEDFGDIIAVCQC